jgi:hypothetical protein
LSYNAYWVCLDASEMRGSVAAAVGAAAAVVFAGSFGERGVTGTGTVYRPEWQTCGLEAEAVDTATVGPLASVIVDYGMQGGSRRFAADAG